MKRIDYEKLFRRHWRALIAALVAGLLAGYLLGAVQNPLYTATTKLFVSTQAGETANDLAQGSTFAQARVKSYVGIATSRAVVAPVSARINYPGGPGALAKKISANVPADTVVVSIAAEDGSPVVAARLANAVAAQFKRVVESLELPRPGGGSAVGVSIVEGATPPSDASSPQKKLTTMLGGLIGLLLAWFGIVARSLLDTRLKAADEISEEFGVPVLATLPKLKASKATWPSDGRPSSSHAEAYRQLRANLQFAGVDEAPRLLMVTSSIAGEGKSTVSVNLAATLAETDQSVALIDADLRRPSCARYMDLLDNGGLTAALVNHLPFSEASQRWGNSGLRVLTAGGTPPNPSELVASKSFALLVERLKTEFDYVVIDTPPLLPVADGASISKLVDGIILVGRAGVTKRDQFAASFQNLSRLNTRVLGVVLNASNPPRRGGEYEYYATPSTSSVAVEGKRG